MKVDALLSGMKALGAVQPRRAIRALTWVLRDELRDGGRVTLAGLGTFKVKRTAPRIARDVRTGQRGALPGRWKVSFRPSLSLRRYVGGL